MHVGFGCESARDEQLPVVLLKKARNSVLLSGLVVTAEQVWGLNANRRCRVLGITLAFMFAQMAVLYR